MLKKGDKKFRRWSAKRMKLSEVVCESVKVGNRCPKVFLRGLAAFALISSNDWTQATYK